MITEIVELTGVSLVAIGAILIFIKPEYAVMACAGLSIHAKGSAIFFN